jgi:hypothetical protein
VTPGARRGDCRQLKLAAGLWLMFLFGMGVGMLCYWGSLPRKTRAARPVAAECWGLDRWQVEGDSVMWLRFHILPGPAGARRK